MNRGVRSAFVYRGDRWLVLSVRCCIVVTVAITYAAECALAARPVSYGGTPSSILSMPYVVFDIFVIVALGAIWLTLIHPPRPRTVIIIAGDVLIFRLGDDDISFDRGDVERLRFVSWENIPLPLPGTTAAIVVVDTDGQETTIPTEWMSDSGLRLAAVLSRSGYMVTVPRRVHV